MSSQQNSGAPVEVKAVELCKYFTLSDPAREALDPAMLPDQFARKLIDRRHLPDAVQLLAHYLPKRQALFWALTCVKMTLPQAPPAETENALRAAEAWIADPSETNRAAALKAADAADAGTPAGCAALAAYYSDGLPKTEDARQNARAYFLTAKLVSASVLMAATQEPESMQARFEAFLEKGLEIVQKSRR